LTHDTPGRAEVLAVPFGLSRFLPKRGIMFLTDARGGEGATAVSCACQPHGNLRSREPAGPIMGPAIFRLITFPSRQPVFALPAGGTEKHAYKTYSAGLAVKLPMIAL
jgi:hypothetical protein